MKKISLEEQETIITFDESSHEAFIFTYSKKWQRRLENVLKIKPSMDNGFGGREYPIDKRRIPLPKVKRKTKTLSAEAKKKLLKQFASGRQKSKDSLSASATHSAGVSKSQDMVNPINTLKDATENTGVND